MSLAWHLTDWNLRKVVPSLEVPLSLLPVHIVILWLHFGLSGPYWDHWAIIMASDDQKTPKQGTAGNRTHVTNNSSKTWKSVAPKVVKAEETLWLQTRGSQLSMI
jgi:hypothetical protein